LILFLKSYRKVDDWALWGLAASLSIFVAVLTNFFIMGHKTLPYNTWLMTNTYYFALALPSSFFVPAFVTKIVIMAIPDRYLPKNLAMYIITTQKEASTN